MFEFDLSKAIGKKQRCYAKGNVVIIYEFKCSEQNCNNSTFVRTAKSSTRTSGRCHVCANRKKIKDYAKDHDTCHNRLRPYQSLYNSFASRGVRGFKNDLTFEEFIEFTNIKSCYYCDSEVTWSSCNLTKNGYRYNLDRKDNSLGYFKANLIVCCWECNDLKSNIFTHEEFILIGKALKQIHFNRQVKVV